MKKEMVLLLAGVTINACAGEYYYENGKKIEVHKLPESRVLNSSDVTYYKTEYGHKIGVNNEIIVQCKNGVNCMKVFSQYGLNDISKLSAHLFLVKVNSDVNVFTLSRKLYDDDKIVLAHPNFIKNRKKR